MAIKNFLLSIFIAFVGTHATAQAPEFVSKTDSLLNYLHQNNRFCGSVMVSKGSNTLYQKDFKSSDDVKVKESFRIGSVTKLFTAVIIYQLIEENKLSLQTKLSVFFPTIKNSKNITIKHLLGHQSGIRDILSDDNFEKIRTKTTTRESLVKIISNYKSQFKPGKSTQYSNSNYIILGYIIEIISKMPFKQALGERILMPLSLNATWLEGDEPFRIRNSGYTFNGSKWLESPIETHPSVSGAAGAMISSPQDLSVFIKALFSEKLIKKSSLDSMCRLSNKTYGYGIFYTPYSNHKGYGHTGHIDEFRSAITYFSEDSTCVALCFNGLNYSMNSIALGILANYYKGDYKLPDLSRINLSAEELKKFEGIYRLKLFRFLPLVKVKITSENGVLFTATLKNFETEKTIAEPVSANKFVNFQYKSSLEFNYKRNGKLKGCYLVQGKNKLYCKRLKSL